VCVGVVRGEGDLWGGWSLSRFGVGGLVVMGASGLAVWVYCWDLSFDVCWVLW